MNLELEETVSKKELNRKKTMRRNEGIKMQYSENLNIILQGLCT